MEDIHIYDFGDLCLDTRDTTDNRFLLRGQPFPLRDKEFSLLCILVENHGQELSKEYLIEKLWPNEYRNLLTAPKERVAELKESIDGRLHRQLHNLRIKIGKDKIKRTKGKYCFVADVKEKQETAKDEVYIFLKFKIWNFKDKPGRMTTFLLSTGIAISLIYSIAYTIVNRSLIDGKEFRLASHLSVIQFLMILGVFIHSLIKFSNYTRGFQKSGSNLETTLMKICGYSDPEK